jgi:hypothetical protein
MGTVTGQASRFEKKKLGAIDHGKLEKKPDRKAGAEPNAFMLAVPNSTQLESVRDRLTREYVPGNYYQPALLQEGPIFQDFGGPRSKHDWPAFREANLGVLVQGQGAHETRILNFHAICILRDFRRLIEAAEPESNFVRYAPGDSNDGSKSDDVSDLGPTPEKILSLWCGSVPGEANHTGRNKKLVPHLTSKEIKKIWKQRTEPVVDQNYLSGDCSYQSVSVESGHVAFEMEGDNGGREIDVEALLSVGDLMFDRQGRLIKFVKSYKPNGEKNWVDFLDRTRQSKGNAKPKNGKQKLDRLSRYITLDANAMPKGGVDFMAGQIEPKFTGITKSVLNDAEFQSDLDPESIFHNKPQSSFDPLAMEQAKEREQEFASTRLEEYKTVMGRLPYKAMTDAAMGLRLCEIGGGSRGDKRAIAKAKTLITVAVMACFDDEYESSAQTKLAA